MCVNAVSIAHSLGVLSHDQSRSESSIHAFATNFINTYPYRQLMIRGIFIAVPSASVPFRSTKPLV